MHDRHRALANPPISVNLGPAFVEYCLIPSGCIRSPGSVVIHTATDFCFKGEIGYRSPILPVIGMLNGPGSVTRTSCPGREHSESRERGRGIKIQLEEARIVGRPDPAKVIWIRSHPIRNWLNKE